LADKIDGAKFFPTFEAIAEELKSIAVPGDIIVTVGAGDVFKIGEALIEK